jgi:hypothetical protein
MKAGAVTGLSIGYWVRESSFDEKTGIRTLTKLDLVEVSLVTFPANDDARVEAVKFKLAHGELPNIREFEKLLREAGFSKTQAAVVANHGLPHLLRSESEGAAAKEGLRPLPSGSRFPAADPLKRRKNETTTKMLALASAALAHARAAAPEFGRKDAAMVAPPDEITPAEFKQLAADVKGALAQVQDFATKAAESLRKGEELTTEQKAKVDEALVKLNGLEA